MILVFGKSEFTFPRIVEGIEKAKEFVKEVLLPERYGSKTLEENLKKELALEAKNPWEWVECHRVMPRENIEVMWAVSGASDLRWALKHRKEVDELWAGPGIAVVQEEEGAILLKDEVDRVIVPSEWVRNFFVREAPGLENKIYIWPIGIDTDYWKPDCA